VSVPLIAPIEHELAAALHRFGDVGEGCAVGLGPDGAASNNDLNMWEEMDTAAKLHKLISKDRNAPGGTGVRNGDDPCARALHLDSLVGSLEEGKRADIDIVDIDDLNQTPFFNVYSHLVYATKANDVGPSLSTAASSCSTGGCSH